MMKTMMTTTVMNKDNGRGEGGGALRNNQTKDDNKDDNDFKENDWNYYKNKNKNKNNNQLTTVYWGGVIGNGGAREGGKEGEGRVGNKMTGGKGA